MEKIKVKIIQKNNDNEFIEMMPETVASQVEEEPERKFVTTSEKEWLEQMNSRISADGDNTEIKNATVNGSAIVTHDTLKKGQPDGVATLDFNGKVPTSQLPSVSLKGLFYGGIITLLDIGSRIADKVFVDGVPASNLRNNLKYLIIQPTQALKEKVNSLNDELTSIISYQAEDGRNVKLKYISASAVGGITFDEFNGAVLVINKRLVLSEATIPELVKETKYAITDVNIFNYIYPNGGSDISEYESPDWDGLVSNGDEIVFQDGTFFHLDDSDAVKSVNGFKGSVNLDATNINFDESKTIATKFSEIENSIADTDRDILSSKSTFTAVKVNKKGKVIEGAQSFKVLENDNNLSEDAADVVIGGIVFVTQ